MTMRFYGVMASNTAAPAAPASPIFNLNDDGTVAGAFGYLHLETTAPDYQAFSKTQLSAETAANNVYIALADDPLATDAVNPGSDVVVWGAEITDHTGATADINTGSNFFGVGALWSGGAGQFYVGHGVIGAADREIRYSPFASYGSSLATGDSGADLGSVTHKVVCYFNGATGKIGYAYYDFVLGDFVDKGYDPAAGTFTGNLTPYMFMDNDSVAVAGLNNTTLTGSFKTDTTWLSQFSGVLPAGAKAFDGTVI